MENFFEKVPNQVNNTIRPLKNYSDLSPDHNYWRFRSPLLLLEEILTMATSQQPTTETLEKGVKKVQNVIKGAYTWDI